MSISARPHSALVEKQTSLDYLDYLKFRTNQHHVLRENSIGLELKLQNLSKYNITKQLPIERAYIEESKHSSGNVVK